MALGCNGRLRGCCGQDLIPGIYLEGRRSGLGHPTKLAGVQYVPLQSGAQGSRL